MILFVVLFISILVFYVVSVFYFLHDNFIISFFFSCIMVLLEKNRNDPTGISSLENIYFKDMFFFLNVWQKLFNQEK